MSSWSALVGFYLNSPIIQKHAPKTYPLDNISSKMIIFLPLIVFI